MKHSENFEFSRAMRRNRKEDQERKWRVIMKIPESPEGDFRISDSICPVGTQLVLYDYTVQYIAVIMEVYFIGCTV